MTDEAIREAWQEGSRCEIYSKSAKQWLSCEIIRIYHDKEGEWIEVSYSKQSMRFTKEVQRHSDCIRPLADCSLANTTASHVQLNRHQDILSPVYRRPKDDHSSPAPRRHDSNSNRLLSLVRHAETKRLSQLQTFALFRKEGASESQVNAAYSLYYKEEGMYKIRFEEFPLGENGFSVAADADGKNAIVTSIQNQKFLSQGMKMFSRIYAIDGKRVDGMELTEILHILSTHQSGVAKLNFIVFKESRPMLGLSPRHAVLCSGYIRKQCSREAPNEIKQLVARHLDGELHVRSYDDTQNVVSKVRLQRDMTLSDLWRDIEGDIGSTVRLWLRFGAIKSIYPIANTAKQGSALGMLLFIYGPVNLSDSA